jgi:glycosyltransferase involved in cell wall biosynthesis
MAARYPLTPLALRDALGVLVHTREAFDELRRENHWPVAYAPLPFASARALSQKRYARKIANRQMMTDETPYRLIVFGYLGRNRRLDVILNALAQMPEGKRFHLDIYGEVLDGESLYPLIASLKLEEQVTLRGFVSDQKLDEALDCADLAFNLRNPTMGEASGSQLRLWNHALPSLVTKIGWYATLPEDAVAHVRPEHEIEDIQTHLRALLREQSRFKTMGERGRVILEQEHAPERYADTLIALAGRAVRFQPQSAANKLAERAGALISEWNESLTPDESVKKVAAEIRALFSAASGTVHDAASIRASAGKRRTQ